MSLNSSKTRMLSDALRSLTSATSIAADISECPNVDDLQAVTNAANQARQAAKELDMLAGFIRASSR